MTLAIMIIWETTIPKDEYSEPISAYFCDVVMYA